MSTRMSFSGLLMYLYFDKCCQIMLLKSGVQSLHIKTTRPSKIFITLKKNGLLPYFLTMRLSQKEWMTNVMHKPYSMKVKDFGNHIKAFNCFLALMLHEGQDSVFTDTDLKALLLKSMPLSWQNAYLLKGTCVSDNFCQMLSYFVQSQSIGDSQVKLNPSFPLPHYMVVGDSFHVVVLDMANLAIQHQTILMVTRASAFLINQIKALVVFIWTIMALVLFILLSPILGTIALTILRPISKVARMLETRKEADKPDVVCITLIKEDGEVDVVNTILISSLPYPLFIFNKLLPLTPLPMLFLL